MYPIVGNFCELVENMIFMEQTFADCLLVPPKDAMPPNFVEKTFPNSHEFHESFPPRKFPAIRYFSARQNAHDE